jgi:hypothetical protein
MTPAEAAAWMQDQVNKKRYLYQSDVAAHLLKVEKVLPKDERRLTYFDDAGNLCIARSVLTNFRELEPDDIVYERSDKCWRRRKPYDAAGRRQD